MKKTIAVLLSIALIVLLYFEFSQDALRESKPEKKPNDWFFMQRAFPYDQINYDAVKTGYNQARSMKDEALRSQTATWDFGGPVNLGGRISAVAMHPSDASTIYIGAASGGIFKSDNAGLSWIPVFEDAMSLSIGDVEIAQSDPDILYVGTGESNAGGGSLAYDGFGIYKSQDAGSSWDYVGLEESGSIGRVVIHPENPDIVYVAAMGRLFSDNPERGIFKTIDGGQNWDKVLYKTDSTGAIDLVMHPENPDVLYAALWERVRRPERRNYGGASCGIYKTEDGGNTWLELSNGLPSPSPYVGRIGLDISRSDPNVLYAIYADNIGFFAGIYKTIDNGDSWTRTNDDVLSGMYQSYGWWFGRIHVDPTDPDIVFPIGFDLYKSSNGGNSYFNISSSVHVDQHDLVAHPQDNDFLVLGNDGGVYLSNNGGNSWNHLENLPVMQFYTCEVDEQFPERLYGGAQDMGTNRTLTGALNDWHNIFGGDGFYVLVDPQDNDYVYVSYQYGNFFRSTNGGSSFYNGMSGIGSSDRKNWMAPVVFDPNDPTILYYGSDHVYKSTNRAASWTLISPDLSNGPGTGNLAFYGTVSTIAVSAADPDYIYAGTDDGNAWVTKNGGLQWTNISAGLPVRWVTRVAADQFESEKAFICLSGYRYDSYLSHIFMTDNAGADWTDISGDLPEVPVNDIIIDPEQDSTLYIATDFGVFVTQDYGLHWQSLGTALPNVPIVDLRLHNPGRKLIAATYGRSMYTFDLNALVGISNQALLLHEDEVTVYPNPCSNTTRLLVTRHASRVTSIDLYDISGRKIRRLSDEEKLPGRYEIEIDVRDLPAGVYFIRIQSGGQVTTRKFSKL
ncbi:MAG: T9SS type A sorting domain-containing protein [Bacteroidota bacterium]|nr:T9SS type A sorting domain-containing protein [Bacteroidota bacterium]